MNKKIRGLIFIFLISLSLFMMFTTKYNFAVGDYLLESIGLRSWTGNYSGLHLTVVYFTILFMIFLFLGNKYILNDLNIKKRSVLLLLVIFITTLYLITGMITTTIKSNSPGLLAIGYNSGDSELTYTYEDSKYVEFNAELTLTNYSTEKKYFYLNIKLPYDSEVNTGEISFYTLNGEPVIFELEGKETKLITINLDDYNIVGTQDIAFGTRRGIINEIVLSNDEGNIVKLNRNNFFGIEISN